MKAPVLFLIAGLAIGAGVILVAKPFGDGDKSSNDAALAEATARIEALEGKLKEKGSGLDAPSLSPSPVAPEKPHIAAAEDKEEEEKPADPQAALANLMNTKEARSLMKQAMTTFGANGGERFISGMVNRYKDSLGLSDDQVSSITKRLAERSKAQQEKFSEGLDNESKSVEDLMREQGAGWQGQQEEMAAILKEELTEDQYAQYEREQLVQQTQRVERQSQRELERLNGKLELTEAQQDQVFGTLVRTSSGYDASMQIEGAGTTAAPTTVDAGADQEAARQEAIRAVLTPEQTVKYDEDLANPSPAQRWGGGGFGGGGFGGFGGGGN